MNIGGTIARPFPLATVFLAIGGFFLCLGARERLRKSETTRVAARAWLRIGLIFCAVGGYLYFTRQPAL